MLIAKDNLKILNSHYSPTDIKRNIKKWICPLKYGLYNLRTFLFMRFSTIIGIYEPHTAGGYLKSEIEKIWADEYETLNNTSLHKFRSVEDVNEWLFRMMQLLKGDFLPRSYRFGRLVSASNIPLIKKFLRDKRCKVLCINDDPSVENFEEVKKELNSLLNEKFPTKSMFEKY